MTRPSYTKLSLSLERLSINNIISRRFKMGQTRLSLSQDEIRMRYLLTHTNTTVLPREVLIRMTRVKGPLFPHSYGGRLPKGVWMGFSNVCSCFCLILKRTAYLNREIWTRVLGHHIWAGSTTYFLKSPAQPYPKTCSTTRVMCCFTTIYDINKEILEVILKYLKHCCQSRAGSRWSYS